MSLERFIEHCNNNILENNAESDQARDYLVKTRGLKIDTLKKHNLGYCSSYEKVPNEIAYWGRKAGDKSLAYFIRGRIIVPIYDEFGAVIAFATRKPTTEPGNSWWNCAFKKGHHLFLLDKARKSIYDKNKVYLVEGYIDALVLSQEGLDNVVGLMGVVISSRKLGLIVRYCNNVCLCMDVDQNQAGQTAQDKAVCVLKKFDVCESISVLDNMPVGKDPDDFVLENGLSEFLSKEHRLTEAEILKIQEEVAKKKG